MNNIIDQIKRVGDTVNLRLIELMDIMCEPGILKDAMSYSLLAGGKRLRPVLCIMSAGMFGDESDALDIACAIEMIHTYSLVHDDLPAMDNDSIRRGKPANHIVFGEAYAILAGDGLLNCAFEVMLKCARQNEKNGLAYMAAMEVITNASGTRGMIAGQAGDIEFEGASQDQDVLEFIHERKTAAMIKASVLSGAVLRNISAEKLAALNIYGSCIGLVFQIIDDILDETGSKEKLGKTTGKDINADKQTFARLFGIGKSRQIAQQKTDEAIRALECFGNRANNLRSLAIYLLNRKN